ncbi:unnamed protein product [Lactuca saligna]|uniref:Uncharacterized protein n=1 Tax=Lactuca saligna TaxID=75948 RepID=A0AA35VH08_LACSI|nr:unnamed protein product [Lactuca saligna]
MNMQKNCSTTIHDEREEGKVKHRTFIDNRVEQKGGRDEIVNQKEPDVQEHDKPLMIKSRTDENVALISDPLVAVKNEEFVDNVEVMPAVMEAPKVQKPSTNESIVVKEVKRVEIVKKATEKKSKKQKSSKSQSSDMAKTIFKPQQEEPKEPESDWNKVNEVEMEASEVEETKYNILDHCLEVMKSAGLKPSLTMYNALIIAYAQRVLSNQATNTFRIMTSDGLKAKEKKLKLDPMVRSTRCSSNFDGDGDDNRLRRVQTGSGREKVCCVEDLEGPEGFAAVGDGGCSG